MMYKIFFLHEKDISLYNSLLSKTLSESIDRKPFTRFLRFLNMDIWVSADCSFLPPFIPAGVVIGKISSFEGAVSPIFSVTMNSQETYFFQWNR